MLPLVAASGALVHKCVTADRQDDVAGQMSHLRLTANSGRRLGGRAITVSSVEERMVLFSLD
jgi:hypothetical protein